MIDVKNKNQIIIEFIGDKIIRDYDKSWDCLMIAVEKIEKLNNNLCAFTINKSQVDLFYGNNNFSFSITELRYLNYNVENKFDILYYAVAFFIEWYNKNF
jgi:hypothetical protein